MELKPEEIFAEGGSAKAIEAVKADYAGFVGDVSTKKGREEIASTAFKVGKEKNRIDAMGKEFVSELKEKAKVVDKERKVIWDTLETLQAQIRKPVTDFETRDKERIAMIESQLADLIAIAQFETPPSSDDIAARLRALEMSNFTAWDEFEEKAKTVKEGAIAALNKLLADTKQREHDMAELNRLRLAEEARVQKERDEEIARRAAENAKKAAEIAAKVAADEAARIAADEAAKIEAARQAALAEKAEAEARLARAEAEAKAAAEKAESDRLDAIEKAKRDAEAAVEAERQRQAAEKAEAERQIALREADIAHKKTVNNAAKTAFIEAGLSDEDAVKAVIAIASGKVPNVKINY